MHLPIILDAVVLDWLIQFTLFMVAFKFVVCVIVWAIFGLLILAGLCDVCFFEAIREKRRRK